MADQQGQYLPLTVTASTPVPYVAEDLSAGIRELLVFQSGAPLYVLYFLMNGLDTDGTPTKRSWVVTATPDFTTSRYVGVRGGATPFSNVFVAVSWRVAL